jgi:hypothetical protein
VELSTDQKGAIAESAIVHAAIKLGIGVYRPLSDGERYDLIFDLGERLERIQCKWASTQPVRSTVWLRTVRSSTGASTFRPAASSGIGRSRFESRRVGTTSTVASTGPKTSRSSG